VPFSSLYAIGPILCANIPTRNSAMNGRRVSGSSISAAAFTTLTVVSNIKHSKPNRQIDIDVFTKLFKASHNHNINHSSLCKFYLLLSIDNIDRHIKAPQSCYQYITAGLILFKYYCFYKLNIIAISSSIVLEEIQ